MKTSEFLANKHRYDLFVENFWLGLGDTSQLFVKNPLTPVSREDIEDPVKHIIRVLINPDNFFLTCKHILNVELHPFQLAILHELWHRKYPMLIASRGGSKSFLLAVYSLLRCLLFKNIKVVIVGAAFRQSKIVFEYAEHIWNNAPILRDIVGQTSKREGPRRDIDRCIIKMGSSEALALPLGDGSKIRGQRANIIVADEFSSINRDIYENVISGFAVVSASPIDAVKRRSRLQAMKEKGDVTDEQIQEISRSQLGNQAILSGTAFYAFNHFCDYWKNYKAIIHSRGDKQKLEEIFAGDIPEGFNWKDFSIIRIPHDKLPKGFLDEKHVSRAKATVHTGSFGCEYGAVFSGDSNGFYRRKLIESCVCSAHKDIKLSSGKVSFTAQIKGSSKSVYVYGVDPASESDNFSIVIVECFADHRRIVYCWTTTRAAYKLRLKKGLINEEDFYGYTARKIRELMRSFPCQRIGMDSQGGGIAVMEALHDKDKMVENEKPIWPVIDPEKEKDTDDYAGEHILDLINFAKADWVSEANHGMRKDFEDKALLFPEYDDALLGISIEEDKVADRQYDTFEDCLMEIEELKNELCTIVHTQTKSSMRDRWDTPEVKLEGGRKGRLRKDRYSALLMANMIARTLARTPPSPEYKALGGFAHVLGQVKRAKAGKLFEGPDWYVEHMNKEFGAGKDFGGFVTPGTRQSDDRRDLR